MYEPWRVKELRNRSSMRRRSERQLGPYCNSGANCAARRFSLASERGSRNGHPAWLMMPLHRLLKNLLKPSLM